MDTNRVKRLPSTAVLALGIGCASPEPARETAVLPATGLIARAERVSPPLNSKAGKTVYVELTPGTRLGEVLNLTLFGSLVPGMTCQEAAVLLGVSGRYGDSCTFDQPSARVYVAYEPSSSLGTTFHRRTLYGYPNEEHDDAERIISSHLEPYRAVAAPGVILELIVAESGDNHRAWVLVDGESVRSVNWWTPSSRRGPGEPRAEPR
jgi:hypothetical protein